MYEIAEYMYLENAQYNALNNAKIECTSLKTSVNILNCPSVFYAMHPRSQKFKSHILASTPSKDYNLNRSRDLNTTNHGWKVCYASVIFIIIMSTIFYLGRLNSNRFYDLMLSTGDIKNVTNTVESVEKKHAVQHVLKRGCK